METHNKKGLAMNKLNPFTLSILLFLLPQYSLAEPLKTFSFSQPNWQNAWQLDWNSRLNTTKVITSTEGASVLQVNYPEGGVGPSQSGVQFPIRFSSFSDLAPAYHSLKLGYCLTFSKDFDFVKGGKLPGLMGAGDSWTRSGGNQPDGSDGWTMRYMWREKGEAVIYAYLPPSPNGRYGGTTWGQDISLNKQFIPGQQHCLTQEITINDVGQENGQLKVWFDGELVIERKDVSYRLVDTPEGYIGAVMFSSFHGGNNPSWAPRHLSSIEFSDLTISTTQ
jgi:hypothetical protein